MHIQHSLDLLSSALRFHASRRAKRYAAGGAVLIAILSFLFLLPPFGFPTGEIIVVEKDVSFSETADMLEARHVISSAFLLKAVARISRADRDTQAGRYYFSAPAGLSTVLFRLTHGISGIPSIRVTFPEGVSAREMGLILEAAIPNIEADVFAAHASQWEGWLFPDTYDFYADSTLTEIEDRMTSNFYDKYTDLEADVASSGHSELELVTMASLLEKEGKTDEERRLISGILWKRIEIEMPLQVDAVFGYIHGRDTYSPSFEDLESDSPYNTYENRGLPPGPIGNPGLEALSAAAHPIKSDYLYYLTGTDGETRYAKTFEEHKRNRELYLK